MRGNGLSLIENDFKKLSQKCKLSTKNKNKHMFNYKCLLHGII